MIKIKTGLKILILTLGAVGFGVGLVVSSQTDTPQATLDDSPTSSQGRKMIPLY